MPKVYTRRGDAGETGLLFGGRVAKDDPRCEAYGTVDSAPVCHGTRPRPVPGRLG